MRIKLSVTPMLLLGALAAIAPFLLSSVGTPRQDAAPVTEPTNPLAWLEGDWIGEGFGGVVEETWLPLRGGTMVGVFRLTVENRLSFCELMTISFDGDVATMRLKHFHPDLRGWEEKDESLLWPQSDSAPNSIRFGPALYELDDPRTLRVWVEMDEEQPASELVFHKR